MAWPSTYKPGGTATLTTHSLLTKNTSSGEYPGKLGRWSYIVFDLSLAGYFISLLYFGGNDFSFIIIKGLYMVQCPYINIILTLGLLNLKMYFFCL